jgi:probable rRNA maturation factor
MQISLTSTLKNKKTVPESFRKLPFQKIKDEILGKNYELSLVLIGRKLSKSLNLKYRNKNYATDVLAFPIDKKIGEICLTPSVAQIKAKKFEMTFEEYLLFLVIHANLHLKGMQHSSKMERYERAYYSRYRRRYL